MFVAWVVVYVAVSTATPTPSAIALVSHMTTPAVARASSGMPADVIVSPTLNRFITGAPPLKIWATFICLVLSPPTASRRILAGLIVCGFVNECFALDPLALTPPAVRDDVRSSHAEVATPEFIVQFLWVELP